MPKKLYEKGYKQNCEDWAREEDKKGYKCECGCGKNITVKWQHKYRGVPKYLKGHTNGGPRLGEKSSHWKGGRCYHTLGYITIRDRITGGRRLLEHRLVMEKHLGRKLSSLEMVHHKNGIKDDNRLSNLEIVIRKAHFGCVNCPKCGFHFKIK